MSNILCFHYLLATDKDTAKVGPDAEYVVKIVSS